jgi:hypothetical protein
LTISYPLPQWGSMVLDWRPGISDPSLGGWVTVVLYFIGAWTALRAFRVSEGRERPLWLLICLMLVALGINKQLDLLTTLTEMGRVLAFKQGWYGDRHIVQIWSVIGVAAVCADIAVGLLWLAHKTAYSTQLALLGMVIVLAFVLIRAVSLHDIDRLIGERVLGLKWNWILETGGISIVLLGSLMRLE